MNQNALDIAVKIATQRALIGQPVARLIWLPPVTNASDPNGVFLIVDCPPLSGADSAPWEK